MKLRWRKIKVESGDYGFILEYHSHNTAPALRRIDGELMFVSKPVWVPVPMAMDNSTDDQTLMIGDGDNANFIGIKTAENDVRPIHINRVPRRS